MIEVEQTYTPASTGRGYYYEQCEKCDGYGVLHDDE